MVDRSPDKVVLLGASNLTRMLPTVVATARRIVGRPVRFLIACGHGRSFGIPTTVFFRELPAIVDCGLWRALAEAPPSRTLVLLTDVGNDIMYGVPVETLVGWLRACLDRVTGPSSRVAVTDLPLVNIESITPTRFRVFRDVLYPNHDITLESAVAAARAVSATLRSLCEERHATVVDHDARWYGLDPIHIRRRWWPAACRAMLGPWCDGDVPVGRPGPWQAVRLTWMTPERRKVLGAEWGRPQPAGSLPDGSTVEVY